MVVTPASVAIAPASAPAWAAQVQTLIDTALAQPWNLGQAARNVTLSASQMGRPDVPPGVYDILRDIIREYEVAGWRVTLIGCTNAASGRADSITFEFRRW